MITQDHIEFARRQVNEVLMCRNSSPRLFESAFRCWRMRDQIRDLMVGRHRY